MIPRPRFWRSWLINWYTRVTWLVTGGGVVGLGVVGVGLGVVGFGVGFGAGGGVGLTDGGEVVKVGLGRGGAVVGAEDGGVVEGFAEGDAAVADGFTFFEGVGLGDLLGFTVLDGEGITVGRTVVVGSVGVFTALGFALGPTKNTEALPAKRPIIASPAKTLLSVACETITEEHRVII
jgi:hypothetical protein